MYFRSVAAAVAALSCLCGVAFSQKTAPLGNFDVRARSRAAAEVRGVTEASAAKRAGLQAKLAPIAAEATGPLRLTTNGAGGLRTLGARGGFLTRPDGRSGRAIARDYLTSHADLLGFSGAQAAALLEVSRRGAGAFEVLTYEQHVDGLPVYQGRVRVAVDRDGRVLQIEAGAIDPALRGSDPGTISAEAAVSLAFRAAGFGDAMEEVEGEVAALGRRIPGWELYGSPLGSGAAPAAVREVVFPTAPGVGRTAWRVHVMGRSLSADVVIAADDGTLLLRADLTAEAGRGTYWEESPNDAAQVSREFPDGWLPVGGTVTTGNNADAFLDRDNDNLPDGTSGNGLQDGRAFNDSQDFTFPGGDGRSGHEMTGASSVLHGWVFANMAHDFFYDLGFDEAAGNYQTDNFGRGGVGGDAVVMNIQDSGAFFNAFFASAPEGMAPLAAFGLFPISFDGSDVRDSALDGILVTHEMAHGVTTRMVGGPSDVSCLSSTQGSAMGEGWSDYFGASLLDNPVPGAYVSGNSRSGSRRHPFDDSPLTMADFGDVGFRAPHPNGEFWTAALWDLRTAIGAEKTDALAFSALELTPCRPTYTEARDSILAADQAMNAGTNREAIWTAFAGRGMGFSAEALNPNFFAGDQFLTLATAAFDMPPDLGRTNAPPRITSRPTAFASVGQQIRYTVTAIDADGDAVTIEPIDLPEGASWVPSQNQLRWTANFTGQRFVFKATDARGASTTQIFFYLSGAALTLGRPVNIDGEPGTSGSLSVIVPEGVEFLQFTLRGGEGDPDLTIVPPVGDLALSFESGADETLTFVNPPAGFWFGFVDAFTPYSGVRLLAQRVTPTEVALPGSAGPLSAVRTDELIFKVTVPEPPGPAQGTGASVLRVQTRGLSGDADLTVTRDLLGACTASLVGNCDADGSSESFTSFEAVEIENPAPGDYIAVVTAFEPFDGLVVEASTQTTPAEPTAATEGAAFGETLATGGISTLFGEGLTDGGTFEADTLPLPTELGGVQVFVEGVPAGLFFVGAGQANFQNPFEAGVGFRDVVLVRDGLVSGFVEASIEQDVPRLFGFFEGEARLPVVVHAADNSVVTSANPARPGETLVAFLTGVGSLNNPPASGMPGLGDPLTTTTATPTVMVGGRAATTLFSGWSPGFVSLVQVNFTLDAATPTGGFAQMKMDFDGEETQTLGLPMGAP